MLQAKPPNTATLGTGKKRRYWKTVIKGVIYNQEKTYSGLENRRRHWGMRSTDGRYGGGQLY